MSENFLSRWSKRKLEVRAQEKLGEPIDLQPQEPAMPVAETPVKEPLEPMPELPIPTEADLLAVEQGGDIKAFMVDKVSTELKNKAFKALFSRPEFNVMDGLDIYIDDYNKFTPLSQEDIGKMTFSKQLLSRPDLEVPEKGDIEKALDALSSTTKVEGNSVLSESDKAGEDVQIDPVEMDSHDVTRVIPDESQAIDLDEEIKNRSFEKPAGKQV